MPWFRNKTTGMVWEVEGALAERLSTDPDYEQVPVPNLEPPVPAQSSRPAGPVEAASAGKPENHQASGRSRKKNAEG